MKNEADYNAGWTSKTFNPKTGKWPSGGAARNMNVARAGGAQAIQTSGFIAGVEHIRPLLEQSNAQLAATTKLLTILLKKNPSLRRTLDLDDEE